METRIPSAGTPLRGLDLVSATSGLWRHYLDRYRTLLQAHLQTPHISLVNSGTTACYITMLALARRSSCREVILPAYTAPSLTLPIRKAGLIPRACEISLETFNLDPNRLEEVLGPDTLCILPVHMFGLASDIEAIRRVIGDRDIPVVDDAASSFGTTVKDKRTGTLGDVGFLSFNRGKNLSTLVGGAVVTADSNLFTLIEEERRKLSPANRMLQLRLLTRLMALALAVRPIGYTLLYSLISRYKHTSLHTDFVSFQYPDVLAGAGITLMDRADELCTLRHRNGSFLMELLSDIPGVQLPCLIDQSYNVFNQLPLLIEDTEKRTRLVTNIYGRTGVEVTTLYPDPLHHIYDDLGFNGPEDPFPNATYLSEHIILIPTHPLVTKCILTRIADTIRETVA